MTVHLDQQPLFPAAQKGHVEMVKLLLAHGANLNLKGGPDQVTALTVAIDGGHTEIIKLLLEREGKERRDFVNAALVGNSREVMRSLANGINLNVKTDLGMTALLAASQEGHVEVVFQLLLRGADPNFQALHDSPGTLWFGPTALILAAGEGHGEVVKQLLAQGADVNIQGGLDAETALIAAAKKGHTEVVKLLLAQRADVSLQTTKNQTALDLAKTQAMAHMIKEAGTNP